MTEAEILLSDEFVEFSEKIKDIHGQRTAEKESIKQLYPSAVRKPRPFRVDG